MESIRSYILQVLDGNMTVTGFQTEMCFQGRLFFQEAVDLFRSYTLENEVPGEIEINEFVTVLDYQQLKSSSCTQNMKMI